MTWVLDLDGVVWRGNEPIPGSVEAIARLQRQGIRVTYVTNNSTLGAAEQVAKLASMGVRTTSDDVVSARDLLVRRVGTGSTILCAAAPALGQALRDAGNEVLYPEEFVGDAGDPTTVGVPSTVDCVVVGQRFDTTYLLLSVAVRAALQCGRLIAPNRDPLYPHSSGMLLGTGSLLAAVENATGLEAEVFGKPEQPMVDELASRLPEARLVVGDQFSTDGELARRAGIDFAFVESGVDAERNSREGATPAAHRATDLAALVEALL
jgi:4-nitrophenyl phosphatase